MMVRERFPSYGAPRSAPRASSRIAPRAAGFSLTEGEARVAALLKDRPVIVRKDVESALAVSQPMAVRLLRGLVDKGVLRSLGAGKNTRYEWL
jgi:DNA-binding MarR family transcriptional regulator